MPQPQPATTHPAAERGVFLLLGPAGSGKGTVATGLLDAGVFDRHVSMGDLLRGAVTRATQDVEERRTLDLLLTTAHPHPDPTGDVALALVQGRLIPNAWTSALIGRALTDETLRARRWALDGYPRRIGAAEHLLSTLDPLGIPVLRVLHLHLPEDEVRTRLLMRARPDDTPEAVEQRLNVDRNEVVPTVTYLREQLPEGTVIDVDAWTRGLNGAEGIEELRRCALHALSASALIGTEVKADVS